MKIVSQLVASILIALAVIFAYKVSKNLLGKQKSRPGLFSFAIVSITVSLSALQIPFPVVYTVFSSHPGAISQHHEYWRLVTPMFVQDGGVISVVINVIMLIVFVLLADNIWGWKRAFMIYLIGGIGLNTLGAVTDYEGAGSSGVTLVLALSMVGLHLRTFHKSDVQLAAYAAVACGVLLSLTQNAHGYAILTGAVIGTFFKNYSLEPKSYIHD